jgi:hypothetical protein
MGVLTGISKLRSKRLKLYDQFKLFQVKKNYQINNNIMPNAEHCRNTDNNVTNANGSANMQPSFSFSNISSNPSIKPHFHSIIQQMIDLSFAIGFRSKQKSLRYKINKLYVAQRDADFNSPKLSLIQQEAESWLRSFAIKPTLQQIRLPRLAKIVVTLPNTRDNTGPRYALRNPCVSGRELSKLRWLVRRSHLQHKRRNAPFKGKPNPALCDFQEYFDSPHYPNKIEEDEKFQPNSNFFSQNTRQNFDQKKFYIKGYRANYSNKNNNNNNNNSSRSPKQKPVPSTVSTPGESRSQQKPVARVMRKNVSESVERYGESSKNSALSSSPNSSDSFIAPSSASVEIIEQAQEAKGLQRETNAKDKKRIKAEAAAADVSVKAMAAADAAAAQNPNSPANSALRALLQVLHKNKLDK